MNDDGNRTLSSSRHCKYNDPTPEKCASPGSEKAEATSIVPMCDGGAGLEVGTTNGHLDPESRRNTTSSQCDKLKKLKTRRGTQINRTATLIPKWIEFETPTRARRIQHMPRKTEGNLMPLSDLAMLMSSQSQIAVDHGLLPSDIRKDNERQPKPKI